MTIPPKMADEFADEADLDALGATKHLWWLSFVNDSGFAGVTIVEAHTLAGALRRAWEVGANPGGEVGSADLGEPASVPNVDRVVLDRLMGRDELGRRGLLP